VSLRKSTTDTLSSWKKRKDSLPNSYKIPTVMAIEIAPQMKRKPRMAVSPGRGLF
jgi:hypothetical protein